MNQNPESQPDPESEPPESESSQTDGPEIITRFLDIPKIFHSVEKDMPFTSCLVCGADLLTGNKHYVIEKVFRRNDVIIELAMCLQCRGDQADDGMSEKSAQSLRQFLQEKINFQRRIELMAQVNDTDSLDPWFERCLLSDNPSQMYTEYQLIALCKGPWIQRDFYPALISSESTQEIAGALSPETRDWMDDFVGDNFGMPSEFCDTPFSPVIM